MDRTTCTFKTVFGTIAAEKAPGPSATFSILHVILALQAIDEESLGRIKLAERIGLGEGAVRTIIGRLRDEDLIKVSKEGCSLTEKGKCLWKEYRCIFRKSIMIGMNKLTNSPHTAAILVRAVPLHVGSGIAQRDAAVRAGATSAVTMTFAKGKLRIPSVSDDLSKDFPEISRELIRLLQPKENDVIIVGSGDNSRAAEYGTLAAALTLCGS